MDLLITREHFGAAAESKPAIAFAIVHATATTGKFLSSDNSENLLGLSND